MANWWEDQSLYSVERATAPAESSRPWWEDEALYAPDFGDVNSGVSSSAPDPNASFLDSAWRANKAQMGPIFAGNVKRMAAEVSDPIAGLLDGTFGKPAAEDAPELSLTVNPNGNTSLPASPLIAPDAGMALMDAARREPLRNATLRDLQQSGLAQARAGGAELQQARTDMEVPESGLERYAKLAAISAGPTLAGMTAGVVTKSPAIGAGVSTMFAVPSAYGEARDAGHSVEDAIKYAGVVGGAEVVSERLGFDALLGKLATRLPAGKLATVLGALEKSVPGRALTGAGVEGTTEALSQAAQNAYKIAGLGEHMTFDEFMTDMKDSFGAGAMIGGPLAGSHAAAQSLAAQNDPEARIRRLADEVIGSAPERIQTPETQAVDAGRDAARAIFAETNISNDTGAVIPDPRAIDFSQQADLETGIAPVGVAPESMGDLDQQLAGLAPAPVAPTESAPIDREALLADLAEPELIRGGSRVFYAGDVPSMRARLAEAGLTEGMRKRNEDGTDAGLYFPARMQAEVDAVLRRKPSEDSATEAPTNNATPERIAEVPIASLTLSDDVPQFKSGAREDGVVEPLGGTFDRRGTGPIQVWRRKDGRMEVISGRHRLDLARRSGETTIPAQVYDESQGFDARQAASLDAELNIRDGQGKVKDYVQYFTQPAFDGPEGRQAADARGLLARATGKRAYSIASQGSPELIAAHSADRVTDEAAVQIAQAAPQNAPLQALGMKLVQEGKSIGIAANTMRAVRSMQGDRPQTSGDMFGFDDSAIQDAVKIAGVASRRQREIGERLAAITGAAKRPDVARREGVDVRDPQALPARIAQLRAEKAEWDDWATDPAKVDEIRAELGMEPQQAVAEPIEETFVDDATGNMFSRRPGAASGDMFGGATIEDTNRASPRSRMPEADDLFGGPSMQERVGAAERARDAARNSGDGKRADTGDGGLFDGPRPEQAILRSQRKQEDDYRGLHRAPSRESGSPLSDLSNTYPDDVYGKNAAQYYGHHGGGHPMDRASVRIIQSYKNEPDAPVKIYRAVPTDAGAEINAGDWVTINKDYAKEHGESQFGDGYKIIEKSVKAKDIYTNGDSIHEWGYDPEVSSVLKSKRPDAKGLEVDENIELTPEEMAAFGRQVDSRRDTAQNKSNENRQATDARPARGNADAGSDGVRSSVETPRGDSGRKVPVREGTFTPDAPADLSDKQPKFGGWFRQSQMKGGTGKPLDFIHTTDANFTEFDPKFRGSNTGYAPSGLGNWFSQTREGYGNNTLTGNIRMENPKVMPLHELPDLDTHEDFEAYAKDLRKQGFDGLYFPDVKQAVTFDSVQFKENRNSGEYSESPNIYKSQRADPQTDDATNPSILKSASEKASKPAAKESPDQVTAKKARPEELIEARKRRGNLRQLLDCLSA